MKKTLIISGGSLDREFACSYVKKENWDYIIAADRGLLFCSENDVSPTHIVGDFDSAGAACVEPYREQTDIDIRTFQPEKDWTDTEIAVSLAMDLGSGEVHIIGGTGTRLDHVLGNLQVMEMAMKAGVSCIIADPHNRIRMIDAPITLHKEKQWGHYVSLIPWGGDVQGLTLEGFKYLVSDFALTTAGSRGVSNEIEEAAARITFSDGKLLIIESQD